MTMPAATNGSMAAAQHRPKKYPARGSQAPPTAARNLEQELNTSDYRSINRPDEERIGCSGRCSRIFLLGVGTGDAAVKKRGGKGEEIGEIRRCEMRKIGGEIKRRSTSKRWLNPPLLYGRVETHREGCGRFYTTRRALCPLKVLEMRDIVG